MIIWIKNKFIALKDNSKLFINDVKQQLTPSKKTIHKVKVFCYKVMALACVLVLAYGYGTFNPNEIVTKKIIKKEDERMVEMAKSFGLHEPEFKFDGPKTFVKAMNKCIDYLNWTLPTDQRIPRDILVAMAIIESDYGRSRFATEGNALFGVRTWSLDEVPHMKPAAIPNAKFGVKKYETKCQSVSDVIAIINRHPAYEKFRAEREENKYEPNITKMVFGLSAWSTNDQYPQIILRKIEELTNQ
jgi:hypothetical protein